MSTAPNIDITRLEKIGPLKSGAHDAPGRSKGNIEACVMEAVAFVAGKPWSDHPPCVSSVIGVFMRNWNDNLPDDERDALLRPLIPLLLNTVATPEIENRRATMCADWLIRVYTPTWLRLAKLDKQAALLEALPEITDFARCPSLMPTLEAVRSDAAAAGAAAGDAARAAARAAAGAAARAAAWDAAGDAAGDAARAAAWDAAGAAAWDAARAAAWDAAWDAAGDAAWAAAGDAFSATKKQLQQSAVDLVKRMCALKSP